MMNFKKRILAVWIIAVLFVSSFLGTSVAEANGSAHAGTETEPVVVLACSDYQHPSGNTASANVVSSILSQIKNSGYEEAYGFLCAGDYDYEYTETAAGITSLTGAVREYYPEIQDDNMVFVQGNHDEADSAGLNTSGAADTEHYGVYVINEDDYPHGGDDSTNAVLVKETADVLESYLADKVAEENKKPIFVVSHLPLHYSRRTYRENNGKYAEYIYNVLDEYAAQGQNIIFLYGHNHNSWGYDDYLGGTANYLAQGDTIYVADLGKAQDKPIAHELKFTYMNAGYVGYSYSETAGTDKSLNMTVFEIVDNVVKVERYSAEGIHNLKSSGKWSTYSGGDEALHSAKEDYLYSVYKSPQYIGNSVIQSDIQVTASGLTGLSVRKSGPVVDLEGYQAYVSYQIDAEGYEQGTPAMVRVTLDNENGFDEQFPVTVVNKGSNEAIHTMIKDSAICFNVDSLSQIQVMQTKGITLPAYETVTYRKVTEFIDGRTYLLVTSNVAGEAYALNSYSDGTLSASPVSIQSDAEGLLIETNENGLKWKYIRTPGIEYDTGVGDLQNQKTAEYLSILNGTALATTKDMNAEYTYWRNSGSGGVYTMQNFNDWNNLSRTYLNYNASFYAGSKDTVVYIYEEVKNTVEVSAMADCLEGRVTLGAAEDVLVGSEVILHNTGGIMETVDVQLDMLKDSFGEQITLEKSGLLTGLQLYYNEVLISDDFSLTVELVNDYCNDISVYRAGEQASWTYPTKDGCVFAGWYEDDSYTYEKALATSVVSGPAYAKFVDKDVLGVKLQLKEETVAGYRDLRMLTSVDSLLYTSVGFLVEVANRTTTCMDNTVYETVYGYVNHAKQSYLPSVFSDASRYFMTHTITNIPRDDFATAIGITPVWTTIDGTVVLGTNRTVTVDEILEYTVNSNTDSIVTYDIEGRLNEGAVVRFDIDFNICDNITMSVRGNGLEDKEYFCRSYSAWSGTKSYVFELPEALEKLQVYIQYHDLSDNSTVPNMHLTNVVIECGLQNGGSQSSGSNSSWKDF